MKKRLDNWLFEKEYLLSEEWIELEDVDDTIHDLIEYGYTNGQWLYEQAAQQNARLINFYYYYDCKAWCFIYKDLKILPVIIRNQWLRYFCHPSFFATLEAEDWYKDMLEIMRENGRRKQN